MKGKTDNALNHSFFEIYLSFLFHLENKEPLPQMIRKNLAQKGKNNVEFQGRQDLGQLLSLPEIPIA